jgi:hypothetical protein
MGELDNRQRFLVAELADRAPGIESDREARLGLPHVADPRDDPLVEQRVADRPRGSGGTQTREEQRRVEALADHVGSEPGDPPVGAQPRITDELEHGAVELDDLALPRAHDEPRSPRRTLPATAALVDAPSAGHAQVRVQREVPGETHEQVLAPRFGATHCAPSKALGPAIEGVARLGREDLLGHAARERRVDPTGGVVDCVALGHLLQGCPTVAIPQTVLVVSGPFGAALSAEDVAQAVARGLQAGGRGESDLCPIEAGRSTQIKPDLQTATGRDVVALLAGLDFDTRMRSARAVVLAEERLRESTLRGSVAFEIATRARQGGVPAYAVTAENRLEPFDARILDLQLILEAGDPRALATAGRKLAQVL